MIYSHFIHLFKFTGNQQHKEETYTFLLTTGDQLLQLLTLCLKMQVFDWSIVNNRANNFALIITSQVLKPFKSWNYRWASCVAKGWQTPRSWVKTMKRQVAGSWVISNRLISGKKKREIEREENKTEDKACRPCQPPRPQFTLKE